ncbi:Protein BIG GRAIN 1-like E [Hirschfeldia incana]|nr:Protein BIG GRAIN 1-like E [Hirschfeldia incana]
MSMKGISSAEPNKISKIISFHKRNDAHSGELDVFEAAMYFSGYNEFSSGDHRPTHKYGYNAAREENRRKWGILGGGRRISLDLPIRCSEQVHNLHQDHLEKQEVKTIKERIGNVRHKHPSSPGGKIVSFINSLFHQAGSKKSKTKSKPTDREVDEEIHGGGWMRRRRRSSISHFLSSSRPNSATTTTTTSSSKSLFSSSSSGFRTPPPYSNTRTKNYKQFLNFTSTTNKVELLEEKKINKELFWTDEKLQVMESLSEKKNVWCDHDDDDDRTIKREGNNDDDGMESDSSSDLFELQNYELSRGGLPVYETTNVANINNTHL